MARKKEFLLGIPGELGVQERLFTGSILPANLDIFPRNESSPRDAIDIIQKTDEEDFGLDFEFNTKTKKPSILGVAIDKRMSGIWHDDNIIRQLLEKCLRTGQKIIGHSVLGAERPILEKIWGKKLPLDLFEDSLATQYLCNQVLAKAPGKDEDSDGGSLGFFDLFSAASLVLPVFQWKSCRGTDCDGPCPVHSPAQYCAADSWVSPQIFKAHLRQMRERGTSYEFYREFMQLGEICQMMQDRGIRIDREYVAKLEETLTERKEKMFPKSDTGDWQWFNPKSPAQAIEWFHKKGIYLEKADKVTIQKNLEREATRYGVPKFDSFQDFLNELSTREEMPEALDVLYRYYDYKATGKQTKSWFDDKYFGDDGLLHPRWVITGASSGRMSSSRPNCFSADTEVLTPKGWKLISELSISDRVMQYQRGILNFVAPNFLTSRKFSGVMVQLENRGSALRVTSDHNCFYVDENSEKIIKAIDVPTTNKKLTQLNAAEFNGPGLNIDMNLIKYFVAVQADGSFVKRGVDFSFQKRRKYERLLSILRKLGLEYRDASNDSRYRIYVYENISSYFLPKKCFSTDFILGMSREQLDAFVAEIFEWDGHKYRKKLGPRSFGGGLYCSVQKVNAEAVQLACSISGCRASLRKHINNRGSISWQVDILFRDRSGIGSLNKRLEYVENEAVYCLSVPSSHIMVRRQGKIMITNQCQNIPARGAMADVRNAFIPHDPDNDIIKADFSNLEFRMVAYQGGMDPADIGPDAFSWLVKNSNGELEKVASELSNNFDARDVAKSIAHGNSLGEGMILLSGDDLMKPRTKRMIENGALRVYHPKYNPNITKEWTFEGRVIAFTGANIAERLFGSKTDENRKRALMIQEDIFNKNFPVVRQWQKKVLAEAEGKSYVRSLVGRTLDLYDKPEDNAKIILTIQMQGVSSDHVQAIIRRMYLERGALPLGIVHDEGIYEVPKSWSNKKALEFMALMGEDTKILPGFKCAAKIARAPNWGEAGKKSAIIGIV